MAAKAQLVIISWTAKATGERLCCVASRVEFPGNEKVVIYPLDARKFALDFFEFEHLRIEVPSLLKPREIAAAKSEPEAAGWIPDLPAPYHGCAACEQFLRAAVHAARRLNSALTQITLAREHGADFTAFESQAREASLWSSNACAAYERHLRAHRAAKSGFSA